VSALSRQHRPRSFRRRPVRRLSVVLYTALSGVPLSKCSLLTALRACAATSGCSRSTLKTHTPGTRTRPHRARTRGARHTHARGSDSPKRAHPPHTDRADSHTDRVVSSRCRVSCRCTPSDPHAQRVTHTASPYPCTYANVRTVASAVRTHTSSIPSMLRLARGLRRPAHDRDTLESTSS
jgi:hypothetical protein